MIDPAELVQLLRREDPNLFELEAIDLADRILALDRAKPLDLNDAETENEVAEAIRRLAPAGAYVPLSERYPWRFSRALGNPEPVTIVDAVAEALRASASVHEAERIPHLVAPLIALAEALEHGALVPGPPPGRCGVAAPGLRAVTCNLRAGHAGQHEGESWEQSGVLTTPAQVAWDVIDTDLVIPAGIADRLRQLGDAS